MEGKKAKILLCEDDPNLGSVLKNYLELNDYNVTLERDGRLGLAAFQREQFDLCLLDVMMPNMDGFELLRAVRDDSVLKHLPFVLLSARSDSSDLQQAFMLGANDYLVKPFEVEQLMDVIRHHLARTVGPSQHSLGQVDSDFFLE